MTIIMISDIIIYYINKLYTDTQAEMVTYRIYISIFYIHGNTNTNLNLDNPQ